MKTGDVYMSAPPGARLVARGKVIGGTACLLGTSGLLRFSPDRLAYRTRGCHSRDGLEATRGRARLS
eukprot:13276923-Alexandrium_andersonii.AAC.1